MRATLIFSSWLLTLSACVCGTGTETREYFCTTSDQCTTGQHCDSSTQICITDGTGGGAGAGDSGVDAGLWLGLGSAATPQRASFTDLYIGIGTYLAQPTGSTVIFDNINTP